MESQYSSYNTELSIQPQRLLFGEWKAPSLFSEPTSPFQSNIIFLKNGKFLELSGFTPGEDRDVRSKSFL